MVGRIQQRIEENCKTIWGDHVYEIDYETDDNEVFQYFVLRDYGSSFGPALTMTLLCHSEEAAYRELDRMLGIWAAQVRRGTPMTKEESLEIFGGPRGECKRVLEEFWSASAASQAAVQSTESRGEQVDGEQAHVTK
ncbi:hypothetical protein BDP55DRAFT_662811 [Colletotrichum godetiae]|uniref:Uncharacterized protein n=1 Tax=Colletotrichum godetiae TaxID=1209918 RepID=A0AAJ0AMH7_9PEZI|nr:uncharacterized protein BDP55DRAFT_662811 [Colletotrichum godetiae]KAK1675965.1 hypothetical protein BDP55DRAFT_662811 [Colletotrichum godetiae]